MTRVGAIGLLLGASMLSACNGGGTCTGEVCYSPLTLTCAVGTSCEAAAPSVNGGKPTAFTVYPALPAGMNIDQATGKISGTPSAAISATHFAIRATTAAGLRTGTWLLTITDVAPASLSYSPSTLTCTIGTSCSLTAVTVTGGRPTSFTVSPALPSGLSVDQGTGAITGAPTSAAASGTYTVSAVNAGGHADATVTIEVKQPPLGELNYSTAAIVCVVGSPCTVAAPKPLGAGSVSFVIAPALPAGLAIDAATGAIGGTPTDPTPAANYLVTATRAGGSASQTLTLAVKAKPAAGLQYASKVSCTRGQACTGAAPANTGGTGLTFTVSPALPQGLALDPATGAISGTPVVITAVSPFVVTASNSGGAVTTALLLEVLETPPTSLVYAPATLSCVEGTACGLPTPTSSGGPILDYAVSPALPRGITIDPLNGTIRGKAIGSIASTVFTITGKNSAGSTSASVTIVVTPISPGGIAYVPNSLQCPRNRDCKLDAPRITGGAPASYSVSPTLPAGLSISSLGVISGKTSVPFGTSTPYSVTGTNALGSVVATISITIQREPPSMITYSPNVIVCTRSVPCSIPAPTYAGDPAIYGFYVNSYPPLPSGLTLDSATGAIRGTASAGLDPTPFTMYGYNEGGGDYGYFTLTVVDFAPTNLVYTPSTKICPIGNNCQFGPPTNSGGRITKYTVEPALPQGLSIAADGTIIGYAYTPKELSYYTVTGTNTGGTVSTTISLGVGLVAPSNIVFNGSLGCTKDEQCQTNASYEGSPPDTIVYSPPLPSWLTVYGFYMYGTPPTVATPQTYTVTATNSAGSTTGTLSLAVFAPPTQQTFTGSLNVPFFSGIAVHPTKPAVMFARTLTDDIFGTTDSGATWKRLCHGTSNGSGYGTVVVSPNGTAFSNGNYDTIDKVADVGGAACPKLARTVNYVGTYDTWFAFTSTGRIFNWNHDNGLSSSDDDGATWTDLGSTGSYYRSLAVDPFDETRVISVHSPTEASPTGIVVGTGTVLDSTFPDSSNGPIFNPKYRGYITMGMTGYRTTDKGVTWAYDSNARVSAIDATGAGYRLDYSLGKVALYRCPDHRTPVFTLLYTFAAENQFSYYGDKVSVSGSTIVAEINNKAYFSINGGVSFTQLNVPVPMSSFHPSSVVSTGTNVYYGLGYTVARSVNGGSTFTGGSFFPISYLYSFLSGARVIASPKNPAHVYFYPNNSPGYEMAHSLDGFQTVDVTNDSNKAWYSYGSVFALNPADDAQAIVLGNGRVSKTTNASLTWADTTVADAPYAWWSWYPSDSGEVSPFNPAHVWYVSGPKSPDNKWQLFLYNDTTHTNTDISAATGLTNPAAIATYKTSPTTTALRVISEKGTIAQTTNGSTYTITKPAAPLNDYVYYGRKLRISEADSNVMATIGSMYGYSVGVTYDGGKNWFSVGVSPCQPNDIAIAGSKVLITCAGDEKARILALP